MYLLTTERLHIREFLLEDAAFILELLNSPAWLRFIGDRGVRTIEDARRYIEDRFVANYSKTKLCFYIVLLKENNIPIGMCGLIKRPTLEDVDIGFAFLPNYEKKGYGFEIASATLCYAFDDLQLQRVVAITTTDNENSIKLLQKLGLSFEKIVLLEGDTIELMLFGINKKAKS